jgi:hypothetical protein
MPPVSFAQDIRPLFTREDMEHMGYAFDLGEFSAVVAHAELIYERLADQSMPPANPWPQTDIARFRQWIDQGMHP